MYSSRSARGIRHLAERDEYFVLQIALQLDLQFFDLAI